MLGSVASLPTEPLDPDDVKPLNSQYDAQASVFGSKLQKKLEDAKVLMVGSGALGCEPSKNVALMGVSLGDGGKQTVTDDNAKSTVAAAAASMINPHLHIEVLQNLASPETENMFDDTFSKNLGVVINALDNYPFWSAPKRSPHPLQFSADDPSRHQLVMAASILRAEAFGILTPDWVKSLKQLADAVNKDDDTNYHTDLIAGFANTRARNYIIQEVDKLKAKIIAGGIISAIATSTALAMGLVFVELYKTSKCRVIIEPPLCPLKRPLQRSKSVITLLRYDKGQPQSLLSPAYGLDHWRPLNTFSLIEVYYVYSGNIVWDGFQYGSICCEVSKPPIWEALVEDMKCWLKSMMEMLGRDELINTLKLNGDQGDGSGDGSRVQGYPPLFNAQGILGDIIPNELASIHGVEKEIQDLDFGISSLPCN
ncbi:hypothetical protein RJ639_004146 [Escallonia herrerae]|uniref:Uncharacterized protein n=1 Tax=Escallonia herrerae TaxID=1293975 RepID=A0AA88W4B4_9ASTE|nr:hypothetical protein RJ639_004146 [Escallonia herrerae]